MGIFDRVSKLIKSNANAAIEKMEDPKKQVEQLVLEMEAQLKKARHETQRGMAAERLATTKVADLEKKAAEWERRAEDALRAGDEGLAREALGQKRETEVALEAMRREQKEAAQTAAAQQAGLKRLEAKLKEVRAKKGTIQAKIGYGKNQELSADALDEFERMAGRVDDEEARGESEEELRDVLGGSEKEKETEAKFDKLKGGDVDERLAALKKKLEPR